MVGTQGPRLPVTELPSVQPTHYLGRTKDDNTVVPFNVPDW